MACRVVYDCGVLLQAVARRGGPSFACLHLAEVRAVELLLSPSVVAEVREVLERDEVRSKLRLGDENMAEFFSWLEACAEVLPEPPQALALPRDPDDEIYTNLAVAGHASHLLSWNKRHLDYLMEADTPEGADFCARYPGLKIVTPVEFLEELRALRSQAG